MAPGHAAHGGASGFPGESAGRLGSLLARGAARGETASFERIYRRYHQELYRYCLAILGDRTDAEDALQATMAAALRALPGEQREIALRPWLYRVAHNESLSLLRERTPGIVPDEPPELSEASAASRLADSERLRELVGDLKALPERQRAAIVMRELSGLTYAEIGAAQLSSEAAAKQCVYEARNALRELEQGREMDCERVRAAISERDGRRLRGRGLRAHLRSCEDCRMFRAAIFERSADLQALCPPLPALAATGLLASVLGASGSGGGAVGVGGGLAGAASSGAIGAGGGLAGSMTVKGVSAAAALVLAVGAGEVSGVIELPGPLGSRADDSARAPVSASPAGPATAPAEGTDRSSSPRRAAESRSQPDRAARPARGRSAAPTRAGGPRGTEKVAPAAAPGRPSSPGNSAVAPGQTGSSGNGTAPGNSGSAPSATPADPGVTPAQPSLPPQAKGTPGGPPGGPGNSASAPGHSGAAPSLPPQANGKPAEH